MSTPAHSYFVSMIMAQYGCRLIGKGELGAMVRVGSACEGFGHLTVDAGLKWTE